MTIEELVKQLTTVAATPKPVPSGSLGELEAIFRSISVQDIRALLREILSSPQNLERIAGISYLQGNGFYKIVLDHGEHGSLRLHIWLPENSAEENLHSHRWPLISKVIAGTIVSELWDDTFAGNPLYRELLYVGKDAGLVEMGQAAVQLVSVETRVAGDVYSLSADRLHRIIHQKIRTNATLMFHPRPTRSFSRNILLAENIPVVKPDYLSPSQLEPILHKLDRTLESERY
tara:strand:- start:9 stop:704 length:696 start_codon:yes stop_codon:yes gene_type:complete